MTRFNAVLAALSDMSKGATVQMEKLIKNKPSAWEQKFRRLARLRSEADMMVSCANNYPRAENCLRELSEALHGGPH
jgi:hypothetical protein